MKFLIKVLRIFLILFILFCIFKIINKNISYYKDDIENKNLKKIISNYNKDEKTSSVDDKLMEINSDYKMWINVPNTNISYPVVQTTDNNYYLSHSFNKEPNNSGALFIYDKYNFKTSQNLIIFGHNMRNNSMFASLTLFKNKNFFDKNSTIKIIMNEYIYEYQIFGVSTINANKFELKDTFENEEELFNYLNNLKIYANNWDDLEVDIDSKLLTLYTCSYDFNDARLIVIAKFLKKYVSNGDDINKELSTYN
ncbi:class B sortase [Clostridium perfringens]|nr:class B sortase [Clostridium perfringens]MDK0712606.1 class B sortase [Clostridium perfringens]